MAWQVLFTTQAQTDATNIAKSGLRENAESLLDVLARNPLQTPPLFEKLVGDLDGAHLRRINIQHRLVYQILKKGKVVTPRPHPAFLSNVIVISIMSRKWTEAHQSVTPQDYKTGVETFASRNANGTGPFRLVSRQAEVKTVLQKNPDWWGIKAGRFEGNVTDVQYLPIKSDATRMSALITGEIDFVLDPPLQDIPRLKREARVRIIEGPENRVIFLGMDQGRFSDAEVDRAIDQASGEMDDAKREGLLSSAAGRVRDQVYLIPLHRQIIPWAARAGMRAVHRSDNVLSAVWVVLPQSGGQARGSAAQLNPFSTHSADAPMRSARGWPSRSVASR